MTNSGLQRRIAFDMIKQEMERQNMLEQRAKADKVVNRQRLGRFL